MATRTGESPQAHDVVLEIVQPTSRCVDVGATLSFRTRASCPSGCDLRGGTVTIVSDDRTLATSELITYDETTNETADVPLSVPAEAGEHHWHVRFQGPAVDGPVHEAAALDVLIRTQPHRSSIATWNVRSPTMIGTAFSVKVGVQCSAKCRLTGLVVECHDQAGAKAGQGTLGATPWSGTTDLYWADVELDAPANPGLFSWSVTVEPGPAGEAGLAHESASATFSCRIERPAEHTVKVEVRDVNAAPIEDVEIRLGPYTASTDARGEVIVDAPKGVYELSIRKDGYAARPQDVDVQGNLTVQIEAQSVPTKAERIATQSTMEGPWL